MKLSIYTSVSALALMAAAPALAQSNNSEITQAGSSNTATVAQPGSSNVSDVTQTGATSTATLNQSGNSNVSEIVQATLDHANVSQLGSSGESHVIQNGNQNDAINHSSPGTAGIEEPTSYGVGVRQKATSVDAYSYIEQNGTGAWAEVDQDGTNNSSDIRQGNDLKRSGDRAYVDQSGDDNLSTVKQSTDDVGPVTNPAFGGANTVNYSIVNQSGSRNTSNITQNAVTGENSEVPNALATVNQLSDDNVSNITQNSDSVASVVQSGGAGNNSLINQELGSDGSYASVVQTGAGNASTVTQRDDASAIVSQTGDENRSNVTQNAAATASVTQNGPAPTGGLDALSPPNNDSVVNQFSGADGASATVKQTGLLNVSGLDQDADADATVNQTGGYNHSYVTQNATNGSVLVTQGEDSARDGDNKSTVTQNSAATGASATVRQVNALAAPVGGYASNDSTITQSAVGVIANVSQDGNDQISTVLQSGAGAFATVGQNGSNNVAYTNQEDGTVSDIQQGNTDSNSSGNNASVNQLAGSFGSTSEVWQNGVGNSTGVTQSGANNDSFVRMTGNSNTGTINQAGSNNAQRLTVVGRDTNTPTGNTATITQTATATNNFAGTAQQGNGNTATAILSGAGVSVAGRQTTGSAYRDNEPPETDIWQVSDNNVAYVDQASDASRVTIYQGIEQITPGMYGYEYALGSGNQATVLQYAPADRSRADVIQGDNGNISNITQGASDSLATSNQMGDGNFSSIDQASGSGHIATVEQYAGGNDSYVTQNGTNNTASVYQNSANNTSTITQGGTGNTATVTQGM